MRIAFIIFIIPLISMISCAPRITLKHNIDIPPIHPEIHINHSICITKPSISSSINTTSYIINDDLALEMSERIIELLTKHKSFSNVNTETLSSLNHKEGFDSCDIILTTRLNKLSWEVPNHERIKKNMRTTSFAFGLIGAAIYSSQLTEVSGTAEIEFTLMNVADKGVIWKKSICTRSVDSISILACDTKEAKSVFMAKALSSCISRGCNELLQALCSTDILQTEEEEFVYDPISTIILNNGDKGIGYIDAILESAISYRKQKLGPKINIPKHAVLYIITDADTVYRALH